MGEDGRTERGHVVRPGFVDAPAHAQDPLEERDGALDAGPKALRMFEDRIGLPSKQIDEARPVRDRAGRLWDLPRSASTWQRSACADPRGRAIAPRTGTTRGP